MVEIFCSHSAKAAREGNPKNGTLASLGKIKSEFLCGDSERIQNVVDYLKRFREKREKRSDRCYEIVLDSSFLLFFSCEWFHLIDE